MKVLFDQTINCAPLTSPQREIWFDQMLHGDAPLYNIGGYLRLTIDFDVALFARAVELLVRKFDALRTVLIEPQDLSQDDDGLPMQTFADTLPVVVPFHDFSSYKNPHEAAMAWMRHRFSEPFSLQGEPLFRYALLKLGANSFYVLTCYHHLIVDGWTIALLIRALGDIYTSLERGDNPDLSAPSYGAFIENDRSYVVSSAFAAQRQYWLQKFQPLPEPLFTARYHSPALKQLPPSARSTLFLPRDGYNRLAAFAREHGASTFHAILGAVYVYFTRTAQREELVVGLPVLNRSNAAFKATVGLFVGVSPARFNFGPDLHFDELLQAISSELKQNYRHQRFPISDLTRDLCRVDAVQTRLFDIGVSYERHDHAAVFGQAQGIAIPLLNEHQTTPLMLYVREFHDDEAVQIDFVYHRAYFNHDEIAAIGQRLVNLLDAVQQTPHAPLTALPVLTAAEYRQLTAGWNATAVDYPQAWPVHAVIERQAEATPHALALVFEERQLSYRELNSAANRLAHRLIAAGVTPDTLAGICAERSIEMVVGLLAILKAGGAYVPFDPDYPVERLTYMFGDAGISLLLTQSSVWSQIGLGLTQDRLQVMDLDMALASEFPSINPDIAVDPRQLAYMIYTSGSTGKPKGAGIPHGGLTNRLFWMQDTYRLTSADRVLQKTPFSFDVSVWEFFWPLMTGAVLVVAKPGDHQDPARLAELIQRQGITTLHFVPSMLQVFVEHGALPQCTSLRQVMASGEALPAELQQRFYRQSKAVLYNLYGPTEASIDVTAWACTDEPAHTVPIGRPIANTQIYLLDAAMEPVPAGVEGELYIGGVQLARGYHRRPDLTAECFVPDPFGAPGGRLYRTGDLARWRTDGAIEYLGRTDHQVKIRGLRIELGEVEAALLTHPAVRETVVVAREEVAGEGAGDKRLVAYLATKSAMTAEALRAHVQSSLPDYMTPSAFVFLDALPLSANGKVDRKALPAPDMTRNEAGYTAPRTATEKALAAMWEAVLKMDKVGIHDRFFDLGGHSLLAMQVNAKIRALLHVDLPLRTLFEAPTLRELALRIEQADSVQAGPALLRVDRSGPLPLSFAQQRLWFLDQLESGNAFYNMPHGLRLIGEVHIAALEAALNAIVARHEVLRTAFKAVDGDAMQAIAEITWTPFAVTDLSELPMQERKAEARRLAEREAVRPFDLRTAPLMRVRLLRLDAKEHWLLLTLHHIAADGWSMGILMRELTVLYHAHVAGIPSALPVLPLQYADFAVWQRAWLQGSHGERQLGYWRTKLADAPALLALPTDYPRPAMQSYRGAHLEFSLSSELTSRLHARGLDANATLFMTLLGGFGVLLARYSGQDDICIGTPVANRQRTELEGLIGFFVNTLVLRLKLDRNRTFDDLLQQVRETALAAYAHQDVPFEQLVEALQPERDLSHAPLFQVMFALDNTAPHAVVLDGLALQPLDIDLPIAKFDLTLDMWEDAGRLHGYVEYSTDLFKRATIERMIDHFQVLLDAAAERPETPVSQLPLVVRPVANARMPILDAHLNPVSAGVAGEPHIAGNGLVRGYLRRPDLSAEKFIPDAFSAAPGVRMCKSGDLAVSMEEHEAFFRRMLGGVDEPTAPFGLQDLRGDGSGIVERSRRDVDPVLARRLRERARALGVSTASLCHMGWAQVLARTSGRTDVVFGTGLFGPMQGGGGIDHVMGLFINTLPVRIRMGEESIAQNAKRTHALLAELLHHEHAPLTLAQRCSTAPAPLFSALLNYRYSPKSGQSSRAWEGSELLSGEEPSNYPFALSVDDLGEGFTLTAQTDAAVDPARVCGFMHTALERLAEALETAPDTPSHAIDVLSEEERGLLHAWNQTATGLPSGQTIHALFEACAARHADRPALVFENEQLSYAELNARANRLAHYLRAQDVGADALVGICVERSMEMIVAVLGVLKAGGAYLPLDPALPQARMAYMIDDAGPRLLLTQAHLLDRLPKMNIVPVCLDRDAALFFARPDYNPLPQTQPDHLAYVIYTSGSTGNPKGTLIHHRALVSFVLAQQGMLSLRPGVRVLQWASFNFDASIWDIFPTLTAGAQLCLASSEAVLPGRNLLETLRRHRIERVMITPSSLAVLPLEPLPDLDMLIVAGERCDHALIAPWIQRCTVINAYGPTEATVWATVHPCAADGQRHPPIGRPLANTQTYILDAYLHPVPIGVTGELYIGGEGLARGYLGRPDLTAERFIQNPFSDQPGARMYRTGDLVRYLPEGQIEYVGRIDHQVKIRGYRVELGEIEFALSQLSSVREAVVLAQDALAGGQRLVAYVVLESESDSSALRMALGRSLPDYMVPAHFVLIEQIPININGKIDRKALDALGWGEDELIHAPACTPTEERLAAIWSQLLSRKHVGRDDNFFHIGGHSLLAVRLMARVNDAFGLSLPLSQIFLSPTVATLAAMINTRQTAAQLVVPLKQGVIKQGGPAAPIWLIHPGGGTIFCYRKLADRLDDAHPVYAIQSPEIAGLDIGPCDFDLLCQRYLSEITRLQADGPVYLAGWSLGGALAFRIAHMLEQAGRHVGWVGLFDTILVKNREPVRFAEFLGWAFTRVQADALAPGEVLEAAHARAAQYVTQYGAAHLAQRLSVNPDCLTEELGLDTHYVVFLRRQYEIQQMHTVLMADFVPGKIHAPLHVFRAKESVQQGAPGIYWLAHTHAAQRSTQHTLPGHHDNLILLEENIGAIVQVLAASDERDALVQNSVSWERRLIAIDRRSGLQGDVMRRSTQHILPGHHDNLTLLEENIGTIGQILAASDGRDAHFQNGVSWERRRTAIDRRSGMKPLLQ